MFIDVQCMFMLDIHLIYNQSLVLDRLVNITGVHFFIIYFILVHCIS